MNRDTQRADLQCYAWRVMYVMVGRHIFYGLELLYNDGVFEILDIMQRFSVTYDFAGY